MEKILEQERKTIKEESKKILEEFNRKLDKIKSELEDLFESVESRKERQGWNSDQEFRKAMLQNAPFKDNDLIIVEKGGWK